MVAPVAENRLAQAGAETTEQHRIGGDQATASVDPSLHLGDLIGSQLQAVGYDGCAIGGKVPEGFLRGRQPASPQ